MDPIALKVAARYLKSSCICPNCGSPMVFDDGRDAYQCSSCGFLGPNSTDCPKPGENIREMSVEEIQNFYRQANRVATLYAETVFSNIVAKYKKKREVPKANGKGTTTVYEYSDAAISKRNKDKAERLEKLSGNIHKLRAQVKKDLKSDDPKVALVSLAVGLIDTSGQRVGSESSASGDLNDKGESRYGITTLKTKHITFKGKSAVLKFVGKSGVKHEHEIDDPAVVSALKKAHESCEEGSIFCHAYGKVTGESVRSYLEPFGITGKDLRGFRCNILMTENLKKVRSKGGKLPESKKEREKQLSAEFKDALEETAAEIQHTPKILADSYLLPEFDAYKKDGTVPSLKSA